MKVAKTGTTGEAKVVEGPTTVAVIIVSTTTTIKVAISMDVPVEEEETTAKNWKADIIYLPKIWLAASLYRLSI